MALRLIAVIAFSLVINTLVNGKLSTWEDIGLTDQEYRDSLGREYIFFEITEPEQLAFTYKANPASFTPPWNNTFNGIKLVATNPPCGCGFILNADEVILPEIPKFHQSIQVQVLSPLSLSSQVEGQIALIERGDCSFVSKVPRGHLENPECLTFISIFLISNAK